MNKIILLLFTLFLLYINPTQNRAFGAHLYPEKYYQNEWCTKWGGIQEYILYDKTRVDCLTKTYAVEFDFASKWAEAIGQSLYYSKITGKKPAIILILEKDEDTKYYNRAKLLAEDNNITLWYTKPPADNTLRQKRCQDSNTIYISFNDVEKIFKSVLKILDELL